MELWNKKHVKDIFMTNMLTVDKLAVKLNVPKSWIYDRTRKGGPDPIPFYKIGNYVRFSLPEVVEYLKSKAINGAGRNL